jgi:hypothetical protein
MKRFLSVAAPEVVLTASSLACLSIGNGSGAMGLAPEEIGSELLA